jgi:xanthine dehydrogenase YagS FAD-binding subunit
MRPFTYQRVADVRAATDAGAAQGVRFIAGGTNLLDLMKLEIETPSRLVDISCLPLKRIEGTPDSGLRIGALVTNSDLAADPVVRRQYPVLSQAILAGASGQLRNRASVGGNLLQRTRCFYLLAIIPIRS